MDPIISEIQKAFVGIDGSTLDSLDILNKTKILLPYFNNGLEFYTNQFFLLNHISKSYLIFGHDLGGYYAINKQDRTVCKLSGHMQSIKIVFCNSDLNKFICFNNLFISTVSKMITEKTQNNSFIYSEILNDIFLSIDQLAFSNENNFWVTTLYELSEEFFPFRDDKIRFLAKFLDRENL